MKRYIVTEDLIEAANRMYTILMERDPHDCEVECWTKNYVMARECDTHPVPEWATHLAGEVWQISGRAYEVGIEEELPK